MMADTGSGPPTRPSLLLRIRDPGDNASWQTFVEVYGPLVHGYYRRKGLQPADAADLMQDVLLQVQLSIAAFEYRKEQGRFRDWLGTVARNKLYSFWKKTGRAQARGPTEGADALEGVASPEQDTEWTEVFYRHILQTALDRIRPHFEERTWLAFEGTWLMQRPADEVARELGQELDWIYIAKSRGLKRLREEVEELTDDLPL